MPRCVCLHGHFYQPPRANPWTGGILLQPSAHPFHDWNERIAAECYTPNTAARILNDTGQLVATQNNFARISFNFGPTLLQWLEHAAPQTYAAILAADHEAHGAMAQAYHHMILPLAHARDRTTQVLWGCRDFEFRFGRWPEGMWLPETACNLACLEDMAGAGIQFTVLAPRQARRVRPFGSRRWQDVADGSIDPHFSYLVRLPSGRSLAVFFYDAGLAHAVAFDGLLRDGANFAQRLASAFDSRQGEAQLASIATDGESYGHHHRFGDMALATALRLLDADPQVTLTNYAAFLAAHPPQREVELAENSSWSCTHGVERWRSDCGCNSGGHPQWSQAWRAPLRAALDWLRDQLAPAFELAAQPLLWNPWAARNDFIGPLLDPSPQAAQAFLARHARHPLDDRAQRLVWDLLHLQTDSMLMFTSCGWFFDEISGLETSQILAYAACAIGRARRTLGLELEPQFLRLLEAASGNLPAFSDGRAVYLAQLPRSVAAYAASAASPRTT